MAEGIRIGNIAGTYGDRPAAFAEMLDGPVDVITGDWLAELTMLIMARTRARRPDGGYGRTFITQLEDTLGTCLERGVKIVVNAGGLDPLGCAAAVEKLAAGQGLEASVAAVTGDDIAARVPELQAAGVEFVNLDTGEPLGERASRIVTANAYLGGWGIAAALDAGADVVVTGRVTDAALTVGPAIWRHGWDREDWDALAGAVVAGHVIECGCQATGGNYSFFHEVPGMEYPGFPWADVYEDGSSIIGKHDGTGGEVSIGTVTSQLLYEIGSPRYHNPDVTSRFDSIELDHVEPDRVRISGVKGEPPPAELKVAAGFAGGFRNSVMIGLTGLDAEAKADLVARQMWRVSPVKPEDLDEVRTTLIGAGRDDPATNAEAVSYLEIAVRDADEEKVGRAWADGLVHIVLGSIPGLFATWPPRAAKPYAVYWPTTVPRGHITEVVHIGDRRIEVEPTHPPPGGAADVARPAVPAAPAGGETRRVPLGLVIGARSGDKGGTANLAVFTRTDDAYPWLASFLTVDRLRSLMPELDDLEMERHELPRLRALNFVIGRLLDDGVSSSLRVDPQAKGLGEYLRAVHADVPVSLLDG